MRHIAKKVIVNDLNIVQSHCCDFESALIRHYSIKGLRFLLKSFRKPIIPTMDSYYSIFCTEEVASRQEALLCKGCDKWQRRRCQTGITREQYRDALKSGLDIAWQCLYCAPTPIVESTTVGYEDMDVTMDAFDIPDSLQMENQELGMAFFFFNFFNKHALLIQTNWKNSMKSSIFKVKFDTDCGTFFHP